MLLFCEESGWMKPRQYIQIYSNSQGSYKLEKEISIPSNVNHVALGDMDSDGMIDLVYANCDYDSCYIYILHNNESSYCENGKCRRDLCGKSSSVSFEVPVQYKCNSWFNYIIVSKMMQENLKLKKTNDRFIGSKSRYQLKVIDYNHDGFPDIMAYFENDRYYLFRSMPCSKELCSDPRMRRIYMEDTYWSTAFEKVPGKDMHAVWADFNNDVGINLTQNKGTLDLLINTWENKTTQASYIIFNNAFYDCLFIKSQGIIIIFKILVQSASRSVYPGASYKYSVSDPFGSMRAIQGISYLP